MKLEIVTYPDPRLAQKCELVTEITNELRTLAADMIETMYEAPGVGLAAPQVGRNIRMLVMDPDIGEEGSERRPRVLINPELTLGKDMIPSEQEGCLSVPMNYRATVKRALAALIAAGKVEHRGSKKTGGYLCIPRLRDGWVRAPTSYFP